MPAAPIDHYREACSHARSYVRECIEDALDAVREAVAEGQDQDEALWDYADQCQTVIYTGRAWAYCLGTRNEDAYEADMGEAPASIAVRAMYALMADVREHPDWDSIGEDI